MKKLTLISVFVFILSLTVNSQIIYSEKFNEMRFKMRLGAGVEVTTDYSDIKGSPFLEKEFKEGEVIIKGDTAFKLPLRFNIYTNSIEFQIKNTVYNIGNPDIIKEIKIGSKKFVFFTIDNKSGYFEVHVEGQCNLLSEKRVRLNKVDPGDGIKPPKPAKFVRQKDYFFFVNEGQITHVYNKKQLLSCLNDKADLVKNYMKKNKLSANKLDDLTQIVNYYNKL